MMRDLVNGYRLGATLYMPIVHPKVTECLSGESVFPAPSVVLCLEDALAEDDVSKGLDILRRMLSGPAFSTPSQVFVRPRSLGMALELAAWEGICRIDGFVAPKVVPETAEAWLDLATQADLRLMPTLESAGFFDPARIIALREIFDGFNPTRIAALRLGGNDLLGAMALRREAGVTSWEGPLAWFLSMASSILISAGYPVSAPVYDVIEDTETLAREVARDVAAGFISKTAIHPVQVPVISSAFAVSMAEAEQAQAILDNEAAAVFQIGGVMCEPSTHLGWAERILARQQVFGLRDQIEPWPANRVQA